jgi:hypothetical protein
MDLEFGSDPGFLWPAGLSKNLNFREDSEQPALKH